ncbi:MAG: AhpC/TSA family protein [Phycisphaerales bacterium]|nr:AhpC/TSA family protein [Phycisphaerales bacterium]
MFCREALAEVSAHRQEIASRGARIVLVHMFSEEEAGHLFGKYGLDDVSRVSDPQCHLYKSFGLERGSLGAIMGPKVWLRGAKACAAGHGMARPRGDVRQMPGAFLVHQGEIVKSYRAKHSADHPDFVQLAALPG